MVLWQQKGGYDMTGTAITIFRPGQPQRFRMKLKMPSSEQMARLNMLFLAMVGCLASIVQTQITDTYNLVKEDKKLFRFAAKKYLTEAKRQADELIGIFKYYTDEIDLYQVWLDMTDIIEEDLRVDVQKCYYTIDNQFLKHGLDNHKMYTMVIISDVMAGMLNTSIEAFIKTMRELNGDATFNLAEKYMASIHGVKAWMFKARQVLEPLAIDEEVFGGEDATIFNRGFDVLGKKVMDYKRAEIAVGKACDMNGLNITKDGEDKPNPSDNRGTPWTDAQLRVLKTGFRRCPDKVLAQATGRTVYEVRKKAKELGLKKSPEYLREMRLSNLKCKKQC